MYRRRYVSERTARKVIARSEIRKEARERNEQAATVGVRELQTLGVRYCFPLCGIMLEPAIVAVGDSVMLTVSSKGALTKGLSIASQFPRSAMYVHAELEKPRQVWVSKKSNPTGYAYLKPAKSMLFSSSRPTVGELTADKDFFFDVVNTAQAAVRKVCYALLGLEEHSNGFDRLLEFARGDKEALAAGTAALGLASMCAESDAGYISATGMLITLLTGDVFASDVPMDEAFRFGAPETNNDVTQAFGASFIAPTTEGFTVLTRAGSVLRGAPSMREQLYESIRSDVLPEARGLVTEMLEAGTRLKGAAFGMGGTIEQKHVSAIEQLSQRAADFERRAFARLFLNKSLLSPTSYGWLCNNGLARESEFALISESQPLPGEYQPRQKSLFRPFDSSSQPNADAH